MVSQLSVVVTRFPMSCPFKKFVLHLLSFLLSLWDEYHLFRVNNVVAIEHMTQIAVNAALETKFADNADHILPKKYPLKLCIRLC